MAWLLAYDIGMIVVTWFTSWCCFQLVPQETYGIAQSWFFNIMASIFVVLVFKGWRFPFLRKICFYLYHGSHVWEKTSPDVRELLVLRGCEEKVRCEYCLRCHRTRLSFCLHDKPRRYTADPEDNEMTQEY